MKIVVGLKIQHPKLIFNSRIQLNNKKEYNFTCYLS